MNFTLFNKRQDVVYGSRVKMGKVIQVDFSESDNTNNSAVCGYVMHEKDIDGICCNELYICGTDESGVCVIGKRTEQGIANPIYIDKDNFDELCIMWLALHKPEALREN